MFAKGPESDAATIHAVATALMETEPWDFTAVYYDGIDHFSHAFMAYHPPRLPWISRKSSSSTKMSFAARIAFTT